MACGAPVRPSDRWEVQPCRGRGGALGAECRGRGQDGKDRVLSNRAGPWALACFVFKIRDGDRQRNDLETQGETTRDTARAGKETDTQTERETEASGAPPPPHTPRERQGGGVRESHGEGGAGRPQGRFLTQTRKGAQPRARAELGGSHQPVSPCPPTWLRPGDSSRRGGPRGCLAWPGCPSLSRWGPKERRCPPRPGAGSHDRAPGLGSHRREAPHLW